MTGTSNRALRPWRKLLLLFAALLLAACTNAASAPEPIRVLFVGNSLVYTGNLPAVLDALGAANGRPMHSEMLVKGGATLSERVEDGAVAEVLENSRYDYVVLQERGGDLVCLPVNSCDSGRDSMRAAQSLAAMAREHGATPLFLGTYQRHPSASERLLEGEAQAAAAASVPLIPVSALYQQGVASQPDLRWHDADGMHPGPQLQLLNAVLLYRELAGEYPAPAGFTVTAPMYAPRDSFFPPLLASQKAVVKGDPADSHAYSTEAMTVALALARTAQP